MGWVPTPILPREARFAYVSSVFRLTEICAPFVRPTSARIAIPPVCSGVIDRQIERPVEERRHAGRRVFVKEALPRLPSNAD